MCNRCYKRDGCRKNCCTKGCFYNNCCNNCDDFLFPVIFWLVRDMTRECRCNFVNRYDRYRC